MNKNRIYIKKIIALLVLTSILSSGQKIYVKADSETRQNISVVVDGENKGPIMAVDVNYDNDLYISLKGAAHALKGTNGAFTAEVENKSVNINTGANYDEEISLWTEEELSERSKMSLSRYDINVNGVEKKYYSLIGNLGDGSSDAFLRPISIAMMLNIGVEIGDDYVEFDTSVPFVVSENNLLSEGFMQGVNALLIGDGTTGEIILDHDSDEIAPIASTTKLMTYYLIKEAEKRGDISLDEYAYISDKAVHMAESIDGAIPMTEGMNVPVRELIDGMLLKSSNECAIALAEHVAGSEENFVKIMNEKAEELGLLNTEFYNCNGVPVFANQKIPAKMQNHMTAKEMYVLTSKLLEDYPEILDVTSTKKTYLNTLGIEIKSTNNAMYNVEEIKGLKTGTTNKSGACIVTCIPLEKDGITHNLITVIFGTEGELDRSTYAELTARYAIDWFKTSDGNFVSDEKNEETGIPENPNIVAKKLVKIFYDKYAEDDSIIKTNSSESNENTDIIISIQDN